VGLTRKIIMQEKMNLEREIMIDVSLWSEAGSWRRNGGNESRCLKYVVQTKKKGSIKWPPGRPYNMKSSA
jgi:hypothetical protein